MKGILFLWNCNCNLYEIQWEQFYIKQYFLIQLTFYYVYCYLSHRRVRRPRFQSYQLVAYVHKLRKEVEMR